MKISKLQFVNRDAFVGHNSSTFLMPNDRAKGIGDIALAGDFVRVSMVDGRCVLLPTSSVYITCDPEVDALAATAKPKTVAAK